jgi:type VI secretion system secreted protein VgrG
MTYKLENVFVPSLSNSGGGDSAILTESISINFAAISIPPVGQHVVTGDPNQPIFICSLSDTDSTTPNTPGTGNFDALINDFGRSEQIFIHAGTDRGVSVEHDETHWVGHDRTVTIEHDETTRVMHDRTDIVDHNETITIHSSRSETVDQGETISVGMNRTETVDGNETVSISMNRGSTVCINESITVGASQDVTIDVDKRLTIGSTQDDGKSLAIEASEQITLKTGAAMLTMDRDGAITIKGSDIRGGGSNLQLQGYSLIVGTSEFFDVDVGAPMPGSILFCVQYRETDFSFASRLLEDEGIFYFLGPGKGGTPHVKVFDAATIQAIDSFLLIHRTSLAVFASQSAM